MKRLTATELVRMINDLSRNRSYRYVNPSTKTCIDLVNVTLPNGPIQIRRYNPHKGESASTQPLESISTQMLTRVADSFLPGQPVNLDRILGGSYNTRSALEALIAHTPQFYACYPGRLDNYSGKIKKGHKHLIWLPDEPHKSEEIQIKDTQITISEIPTVDLSYNHLAIPDQLADPTLDLDIQRQHARIQVALVLIGIQLGYKCWVAQNDKGIIYNDQPIGEFEGVIADLYAGSTLISPFSDAVKAALLIDCIWFGNSKFMPAVMEVEHTTGVTSGLTRMTGLKNAIPSFKTRYVIVAPDEDRHKVYREANRSQFQDLQTFYFPYSAVEELFWLCKRRGLQGVQEQFLECYMEKIIES